MSIELSPEWLGKGGNSPLEIIMEFRRKNGGEIIVPSADRDVKNGGYIIEPLQIERIDKQFTAVGYISIIEDMLASVNKRLDDVNARFARFEEVGVPLRFVGGEEETETEINNEEITENEEL
jgi:translation initiation factor 6 (eIF-6)